MKNRRAKLATLPPSSLGKTGDGLAGVEWIACILVALWRLPLLPLAVIVAAAVNVEVSVVVPIHSFNFQLVELD